jgi:flagellar biogenesis protein FliO
VTTPLTPAASALPLRQDDPISLMFIIKVMLITAILLAVVYVVLRWFARRSGPVGLTQKTDLQCTTALRLSSRTRVYLIESGASRVLVTESSNGATVTVLAEGAPLPVTEVAP